MGGDAYIAAMGEAPITQTNSPVRVVIYALKVIELTQSWAERQGLDISVSCRVGVHTGDCVGGIVGAEMQRYHLFGASVHCVELLESTAPPGSVQISAACYDAVTSENSS